MSEVAIANEKPKLLERLGNRFHVDADKMLPTLKATAFKTAKNISNEQMIALLVVADQYDLNPWTKEIYAFPDKHGGIVPVVGVDGWSRIINTHPNFDGMDYESSDQMIDGADHKPCPAWIKCRVYRKDRSHPIEVTEYFDECYREAFTTRDGRNVSGPWQSHPKRFLRHKATIQCARLAFGFVGIFDQDEAERIVESERVVEGDVVHIESKRSTSVAAMVKESDNSPPFDPVKANQYKDALEVALFDADDAAVLEIVDELSNEAKEAVWPLLQSADKTKIKEIINAG